MEFLHFKSQVESYQVLNPVADNIRYVLAKKKIDVIFYLSFSQTFFKGIVYKMDISPSNANNNSKTS